MQNHAESMDSLQLTLTGGWSRESRVAQKICSFLPRRTAAAERQAELHRWCLAGILGFKTKMLTLSRLGPD